MSFERWISNEMTSSRTANDITLQEFIRNKIIHMELIEYGRVYRSSLSFVGAATQNESVLPVYCVLGSYI